MSLGFKRLNTGPIRTEPITFLKQDTQQYVSTKNSIPYRTYLPSANILISLTIVSL